MFQLLRLSSVWLIMLAVCVVGCSDATTIPLEELGWRSPPYLQSDGTIEGVTIHGTGSELIRGKLVGNMVRIDESTQFSLRFDQAIYSKASGATIGVSYCGKYSVGECPAIHLIDRNGDVVDSISFEEAERFYAALFEEHVVVYTHGIGVSGDLFRVYGVETEDGAAKFVEIQSVRPDRSRGYWHLHVSGLEFDRENRWVAAVTADGYVHIWRLTSGGLAEVDVSGLEGVARPPGGYSSFFDVSPDMRFIAVGTSVTAVDDGKTEFETDKYRLDISVWNVETNQRIFHSQESVPFDKSQYAVSFQNDRRLVVIKGKKSFEMTFDGKSSITSTQGPDVQKDELSSVRVDDVLTFVYTADSVFPMYYNTSSEHYRLGAALK